MSNLKATGMRLHAVVATSGLKGISSSIRTCLLSVDCFWGGSGIACMHVADVMDGRIPIDDSNEDMAFD
jgi:hypothetical protein|tara:strand:+ start:34803 stop:35009 length:207 start_codon:yes stop_codon:yes gene_type:complete